MVISETRTARTVGWRWGSEKARAGLLANLTVTMMLAACGAKAPPVAPAPVGKAFEFEGRSTFVEMSADDLKVLESLSVGVDGRVPGFSPAANSCHYWSVLAGLREHDAKLQRQLRERRAPKAWLPTLDPVPPGVAKYAQVAATSWCAKAEATLPKVREVEGDGFEVSFQVPSPVDEAQRLRLSTNASDEHRATVHVYAPPGFVVTLVDADCNGSSTPVDDDGEAVFLVTAGKPLGVIVRGGDKSGSFDVPAVPAWVTAVLTLEPTVLAHRPELGGVIDSCRSTFEKQPAPAQGPTSTPAAACPDGWTKIKRGVCYTMRGISFQGNAPIVGLRVWSPEDIPLLPVTLALVEDGEEKCSDTFGMQGLKGRAIVDVAYLCPPTGVIEDVGETSAVLIVNEP